MIKRCGELISNTDSVRIVTKDVTNFEDLVVTEKMYIFHFVLPNKLPCSNPTQCGFLIKIYPITEDNPNSFDIQLVTDSAMYPADLHYHSNVISAENMHLVIEWYNGGLQKWYNCRISWWCKPEYRNGEVWWGDNCLANYNNKVRLVIYNLLQS